MIRIIFVCCMLIITLLFTACDSTFEGNRIGNDTEFTLNYSAFNTTDVQNLVAESGDTINVKIVTEKGRLEIKIRKDDNEPIYEGNGISIPDEFDVKIVESGIYTVTVTGIMAKGSVSFNVENHQ